MSTVSQLLGHRIEELAGYILGADFIQSQHRELFCGRYIIWSWIIVVILCDHHSMLKITYRALRIYIVLIIEQLAGERNCINN